VRASYKISTSMEADETKDLVTVAGGCALCSYQFVMQVEIPFNDSGMERITNAGVRAVKITTMWMLEHLAAKHFMFGKTCNHALKRI